MEIQISKTKYKGYLKIPFTVSLIVILFTSSNTSFVQKKLLPAGFPADYPLAQPLSKIEVNNSLARTGSDSLVNKAGDLLSQLNKDNVLGAIVILKKAAEIDSSNAAVFYQLSSAWTIYQTAHRFYKKCWTEMQEVNMW